MLTTQHIEFGNHSNIPGCCINYFISDWEKDIELYYSATIRDPNGPNYVRCMTCISIDKRNKLHKCTYECIEFLESIGRIDLADEFRKKKKSMEDNLWTSISQNYLVNSNVVIENESPNLLYRGYGNPLAPITISGTPDFPVIVHPTTFERMHESISQAVSQGLNNQGIVFYDDPIVGDSNLSLDSTSINDPSPQE